METTIICYTIINKNQKEGKEKYYFMTSSIVSICLEFIKTLHYQCTICMVRRIMVWGILCNYHCPIPRLSSAIPDKRKTKIWLEVGLFTFGWLLNDLSCGLKTRWLISLLVEFLVSYYSWNECSHNEKDQFTKHCSHCLARQKPLSKSLWLAVHNWIVYWIF